MIWMTALGVGSPQTAPTSLALRAVRDTQPTLFELARVCDRVSSPRLCVANYDSGFTHGVHCLVAAAVAVGFGCLLALKSALAIHILGVSYASLFCTHCGLPFTECPLLKRSPPSSPAKGSESELTGLAGSNNNNSGGAARSLPKSLPKKTASDKRKKS